MAIANPPGFVQAGSYAASDQRRDTVTASMQRSLLDTTNQGARGGFLPGRAPGLSITNFALVVGQCTGIIENTFGVNQGDYVAFNTANQSFTLTGSSPTLNRIDIAAIRIQDAFYTGTLSQGDVAIFQGTGSAGAPTAPTLPPSVLPIASFSILANATAAVMTATRKSLAAAGGIAPTFDTQTTDAGAFNGEYRSVLTNGAGSMPRNLLAAWGDDGAWHGVNRFRLPRPTPSLANTALVNLASNTTYVVASVTIPDPGFAYYIQAGAGMLIRNIGPDLSTMFTHRMAIVVDTTTLPAAGSSSIVGHAYMGAATTSNGQFEVPAHCSTSTFTGTHTVNLLIAMGSAGGIGIGPLNADYSWWFDVEIQPAG